jgi:O-antigen/teichoic acid export membrane protein
MDILDESGTIESGLAAEEAIQNRAPGKAIATSTIWQFGSQFVMAALSVITVKFVAIGLSKQLAGDYNTAYGYLQIFGILADFGLYAVAVREVSKAKNREHVLGALFVLRCLILLFSMGAAILIAWIIPDWRGTPLPLGVTIAAMVPSFTLLAGILRTIFQIEYRMHYVFIAEVTQRIVTVLLTGVFIFLGVRGTTDTRVYLSFLLVGGIGAFVLFLLSAIFGRRLMVVRPHWDSALISEVFVQAAPYGLAFLCTALYRQFDVTLISQLRPHDFELQNAYYGFVQRMMDMAYLLPTFLLNSTLPALSQRDSRGEDTRPLLGKIFLVILLIGSTAFLFSFFWSRPLTRLLTTETYLSTALHPGSDTALSLLSVSMFMNGIVLFSFYTLLTKHRWKPLVLTLSVAVVLSLVSNFSLIPSLGFVGASYTSIIVHTFLALSLLPQALRVMPIRFTVSELLRVIVYVLLLGVLLAFLRPFATSPVRTVFFGGISGLWMLLVLWAIGMRKSFSL